MAATWWGILEAVLLKSTALKGQRNNIMGMAFGNKDSKNTFQPWDWVWKMNNHGW